MKICFEKIILFCFLLYIPIDMINGILIRSHFFSIAIMYKAFVLGVVLLYLIFNSSKFYVILVSLISSVFVLFHLMITNELSATISSLNYYMKFFAILIYARFFVLLLSKGFQNSIRQLVGWTLLFLFFNQFLGFLGLGYSMYGDGEGSIGSKGFIFSGNEIGVAIVASGSLVLMFCAMEKNYRSFLFFGIIMFLSSIILTSKVSIGGTALIFIVYLWYMLFFSEKRFQGMSQVLVKATLFFLVLLLLAFSIHAAVVQSGLIDRLLYFFENFDMVTALLSQRNVWVNEAMILFWKGYAFNEIVWGTGLGWWDRTDFSKLTEIDFVDILMSYGVVGIALTYGLALFLLVRAKSGITAPHLKYIRFTTLLLLSISLTSGHVFFSGLAGHLISIIIAFLYYRKK